MYRKLLKNDIKYNPLQSFNIAFFIMLAVAFLATATQLGLHLTSSIDKLLTKAKTPHLMQMHTGDIDYARMQNFVENQQHIAEHQIVNFINIDNSLLSFNDKSLKDSVYDNGFSTQSPHFDYLLDLDDNLIDAKAGEVYVPIFYKTSGLAKLGDSLYIKDLELKVAGFVRDSQMNSSLSFSRRFIISDKDYEAIEQLGSKEYLIEFRLDDVSKIAELEAAYREADLEANGPPFMSYKLFQLVNAFSDGISIVVLLLISLVIIFISLICIRLTLLAKLEEDYKELAVLKAIGIAFKDIKKIFLAKYIFIAGISSFIGFLLSFILKQAFLANMRMFFGNSKEGFLTYILGFLASLLVFIIIFLNMHMLAKRLKHLSLNPAQVAENNIALKSSFSSMIKLSLSELLSRKKIYLSLLGLFVLAIFVLSAPISIYSTISDKSFANHLGIGSYDIRIDLSNLEANKSDIKALEEELKNDTSIEAFELYKSKLIDYTSTTGAKEKLWIDFGDHETFPVSYIEGKAPLSDWEIALSQLKAEEISKKVGDSLELNIDSTTKTVIISGIFSDITNGGKTAKASFSVDDKDSIWMIVAVKLKPGIKSSEFIKNYQSRYSFAKLSDTDRYLRQILGSTIDMLFNIALISFISSCFLIFLISILFIRMIYLKDAAKNALLKAIGFSNKYIYKYYFLTIGIVLLLGVISGFTLTLTLGSSLASGALSMMGVSGLDFAIQPIVFILVPIAMLLACLSATHLGIRAIKTMNIAMELKDE